MSKIVLFSILYSLFSILNPQSSALGIEHASHSSHHEMGLWQTLVESNLLNVLILAIAIIYLGNKFLPQMVDQRKKQISKEIEEAKQARIKATEELEAIKKKTQDVSHEIEEMKQEARKNAEVIKHQIEKDTERELNDLKSKVQREINTSWDEAVQDIKKSTSAIAFKLAEESLSKLSNNVDVQKKLTLDFMSELEKVGKN